MEYTAPAIPLTIPKEPNRYKTEELTKIAIKTIQTAKEPSKNATLTKGYPGYFALSQDFKEDPVPQLIADVRSCP
ncbi:hypothetical protein DSO57_1002686 [Entomophthora muscae]|uniref:Uncharacterized protein n=1 Tax=Entomophthora muscae TaxID=34485 RepID=A0ACC2UHK2_9FUNG|nr:hypothetical protein DSO57_1002686 [Entomophthora muscae]